MSFLSRCSTIRSKGSGKLIVQLRLIIDVLPARDYGLSWLVNTPEVTPEPNNLTIAIVDQYGRVQDAAMTIPSFEVEYGTPITASYRGIFRRDTVPSAEPDDGTLSTTTLSTAALTEGALDYRVTLMFNVTKDFPTDGGIDRIRIEYPIGVVHNEAQRELPVTWFGVQFNSELREAIQEVVLESNKAVIMFVKEDARRLQPGQYSITVPVTLPDSKSDPPGFNFYHLTFCRSSATAVLRTSPPVS
ncbi:hypothetical protein Pmar_PMAR020135 [Perkinsus marinus ATCC 50983]|uniref:Uncharacterized protein n=1 Tax=Perkinsus marinus (strain ATCC 50983 / TXsc) TaxID=423536 RepID=C5KMF8_PERM5|nr:hypothetical protein Pmar_PMAR020135 [Perkinsus marinus ATCC 50983]EER14335.1 hypothetical protein Pmar_PMAR020135 [Perkinsus marinus ATCC 50983]|eukprot:XP_002782540.1 hypothetical protein Pmar_PMAR020135 [Perkinsus marinus ATCC 50983]